METVFVNDPSLPESGRFVRIFGVRRSGNHAIADFLGQRLHPDYLFLDQCRLPTNPLTSFNAVKFRNKVWSLNDKLISSDGKVITTREARSKVSDVLKCHVPLIAFFEEQIHARTLWRDKGHFHARAENVVVIRSLSNWLASAFQHGKSYNPERQEDLALVGRLCALAETWLAHVEAARESAAAANVHVVKFDEFASSPAARRALLDAMGIAADDLDLPAASPFGRGSSFKNERVTPQQDISKLGKRSKDLSDDPGYLRLLDIVFQDPRIRQAVLDEFPEDRDRIEDLLGGMISGKRKSRLEAAS